MYQFCLLFCLWFFFSLFSSIVTFVFFCNWKRSCPLVMSFSLVGVVLFFPFIFHSVCGWERSFCSVAFGKPFRTRPTIDVPVCVCYIMRRDRYAFIISVSREHSATSYAQWFCTLIGPLCTCTHSPYHAHYRRCGFQSTQTISLMFFFHHPMFKYPNHVIRTQLLGSIFFFISVHCWAQDSVSLARNAWVKKSST